MESENNLWYNTGVSKYCTIGLFRVTKEELI